MACGWSESMTYARPVFVTATGCPSATVIPVAGAPRRTVRDRAAVRDLDDLLGPA